MIAEARRRQEIEAENEHRAKEMEEARQLQLSMLPKSMPHLPHVEIAAFMKPAAEVGGDYYDFHLGADGSLTIAIGDATGHGLKAGTFVEVFLSSQDVVLLLSDGLPERFNAAGDMFGYERSKESLMANAHASPQAVIERLLQPSEEWAAGKTADDDMTFVALKIKEAA